MKKTLKIIGKTVKWCFIVFCIFLVALLVFLGTLCFREQRLPQLLTERLTQMLSTEELVVRCDALFFGFRHGLRLNNVRVLGRSKPAVSEPVLSAQSVVVDPFRRQLTATALRLPCLPGSYYASGYQEVDAPVTAAWPEIAGFSLQLIRPEILGVTPRRVLAEVALSPKRLEVTDVVIEWSDVERRTRLDGFAYVDLAEQRLYGELTGEARSPFIRPLLQLLDEQVSLAYMDSFTGVTEPVPAFCSWDVNLRNNDFRLKLKLHPELGNYHAVPLSRADGEIDCFFYVRGTNFNYRTTIGPVIALDAKNRAISGRVDVQCVDDQVSLAVKAQSDLPLKDTLAIIDYLNDGTLDCLTCTTSPQVSAEGTVLLAPERRNESCLTGRVEFAQGALFNIPLANVAFDYAYRGNEVEFSRLQAEGKDGGRVAGTAKLEFAESGAADNSFALDLRYDRGSLAELSDVLSVDLGEKFGRVDGWIRFSAPLRRGPYSGSNGAGSIRITDGRLAQMKLFAGLTEYFAAKVPGFESLVTQSQATADFTITNGVLVSDNILIEGDFLSIKAWGQYDIVRDDLDFTVSVRLLKDESLLSKLVHPVTWPFTKLLLEFKVSGPIDQPRWKYLSVLDRMLK